jgi:anti-anti-sigma regulatory factor
MSIATATHALFECELIGHGDPDVVVISFLSHEIVGAHQADDLREQLEALIRADWCGNYVIDFRDLRSIGSSAFAEIAGFVRRVRRVRFCNLDRTLQLGATLIGLDEDVEICASRHAAIRAARRDARRNEDDTVDYP